MRSLILPGFLISGFLITGCATTQLTPDQRRTLQTKEFDGSYEVTFKAAVTVFQDSGYIIKSSDYNGGVIQAETGSQFNLFGSKQNLLSVTLEPLSPERTLVRVNVLAETFTDLGQYGTSKGSYMITDPTFYQSLFQKIQAEVYRRQTLRKARGFEQPISSQPVYVAPGAPNTKEDEDPATLPPPASSPASTSVSGGGGSGFGLSSVAKIAASVPLATVANVVKIPQIPSTVNKDEEVARLIAEQQKIQQQIELLKAQTELEQQKQKLAALQTENQDAGRKKIEESAIEEAERMQRLNILKMGLSKDVDNLWLGSKVEGQTTLFHLNDKKIYWYCKFKPGFGRIGSSFVPPKYVATWYEPSGNVYHQETFTNSFGNAALFRNAITLDTARGQELRGKWRVTVYHKNDLIDDRAFVVE